MYLRVGRAGLDTRGQGRQVSMIVQEPSACAFALRREATVPAEAIAALLRQPPDDHRALRLAISPAGFRPEGCIGGGRHRQRRQRCVCGSVSAVWYSVSDVRGCQKKDDLAHIA